MAPAGAPYAAAGVPMSGAVPPQPEQPRRKSKLPLVLGLVGLALVLVVGGGIAVGWWVTKPDRDYIAALKATGEYSQYGSDASAIAHGKAVCAALDTGGKAQGTVGDLAATRSYCPKYSEGFHVLEQLTIKGNFELVDSSIYYPSIEVNGSECEGSGGYSDITSGAAVTVKNGSGKLLASTTLGPGSGTTSKCEFNFSVDLTEGEDDYSVTVSHRGDVHYTCLLYTSPSPRDRTRSRMPSSA
jgi:hypothetical protein